MTTAAHPHRDAIARNHVADLDPIGRAVEYRHAGPGPSPHRLAFPFSVPDPAAVSGCIHATSLVALTSRAYLAYQALRSVVWGNHTCDLADIRGVDGFVAALQVVRERILDQGLRDSCLAISPPAAARIGPAVALELARRAGIRGTWAEVDGYGMPRVVEGHRVLVCDALVAGPRGIPTYALADDEAYVLLLDRAAEAPGRSCLTAFAHGAGDDDWGLSVTVDPPDADGTVRGAVVSDVEYRADPANGFRLTRIFC